MLFFAKSFSFRGVIGGMYHKQKCAQVKKRVKVGRLLLLYHTLDNGALYSLYTRLHHI